MKNVVYEYFHDKDTKLHISLGRSNVAFDHFHRSVEVLFVLKGKVKTTVGNETFIASAGDIIFVHNYYVHSFFPETDYEKIFFVIPFDYSHSVDKVLLNSTLPSHLSDKKFNRTLLPYVKKLYEDKSLPKMVVQGYLSVIMGSLFAHYTLLPVEKPSNIEFMVDVLHYIDEHYSEELTLDSIATTFGYNKYYFSRLFNSYIGESLSNYINVVRIQHFIRLTEKEESVPVAKLAFDCGFDSLTTFYRYFNKLYGKTPKEYLMEKR